MTNSARLVLISFQDGRAIIHIHYGDRTARLELDQLEDRYAGQPTAERAKDEIVNLLEAVREWLLEPESTIELA
jgi:hypothetical protein